MVNGNSESGTFVKQNLLFTFWALDALVAIYGTHDQEKSFYIHQLTAHIEVTLIKGLKP